MDHQCLFWMDGIEGSLGSQVTANIGPLEVLEWSFTDSLSASVIGIALALLIAESISPGVYSLSTKNSFSSRNLCSLSSSTAQLRKYEGLEKMEYLVWSG